MDAVPAAQQIGGNGEMSALTIGREYYWKRSNGWDWFGTDRWWEVFVKIAGLNGGGGYWIEENWRWNGSGETIRCEIKSLTADESRELERAIRPTPKTKG